eukprot:CAMPEP_0113946192 /NCGR_PEP_ID=MMETSP1339-20121228/55365_1 /TAXON_ID=94617 /ORGANISM="Fibrocapsa japonica" /LENGTH=640 /DNA_ID=CAMNT_0000952161 /DNA_START=51 /DNA_END=1972 /DNA_ORIENTATION=+ /assembly_acc=CAM_ASM_000762
MAAKKKFCQGMIEDLKRRAPHYFFSDWTDGCHSKVLAAIFFMFFTSIAPAITFAVLLEEETKIDGVSQLGAVEVILSTCLTGGLFALFAGQPLCIVGVTGPVTIFSITVFGMAKGLGINFMAFYGWTQIWAAIMHVVLAMTNACDLISWVTRFSCETFGVLIAVIYLYTGIKDLVMYFQDGDHRSALLQLIIGLGCAWTAINLTGARSWVIGKQRWREILADYGATVAIVLFTAVPYLGENPDAEIIKLQVPDTFEATSGRDWLVDLSDIEGWAIVAAIVPGFILTVLFFFDHNVSSLLAQTPEFGLKKGSAYHWDFFIVGISILLTGLLGIPPTNGLIPQAAAPHQVPGGGPAGEGKRAHEGGGDPRARAAREQPDAGALHRDHAGGPPAEDPGPDPPGGPGRAVPVHGPGLLPGEPVRRARLLLGDPARPAPQPRRVPGSSAVPGDLPVHAVPVLLLRGDLRRHADAGRDGVPRADCGAGAAAEAGVPQDLPAPGSAGRRGLGPGPAGIPPGAGGSAGGRGDREQPEGVGGEEDRRGENRRCARRRDSDRCCARELSPVAWEQKKRKNRFAAKKDLAVTSFCSWLVWWILIDLMARIRYEVHFFCCWCSKKFGLSSWDGRISPVGFIYRCRAFGYVQV